MFTTDFASLVPASFSGLRRELDDAFDRVFGRDRLSGRAANRLDSGAWYAPLTAWEDDAHVYVECDIPGVRQDELEITYKEGQLWIRGERKVPREDGNYWHNERLFGRFERVISLPEVIDPGTVEAELHDGVLYVRMTKRPEAKPTKIAIKTDGGHKRLTTKEEK